MDPPRPRPVAQPRPPPRGMNEFLWDMLCFVCKKYKTQTLAVLFVLLEVISVILETFGKNTVGSVLASFILSVFGVVVTIYTTFVMGETIENSPLVVVEVVFSFVQLIVTYIDLIMKFLRTKSNYKVSLFPLAFAIIALVFAFKNNPVDSPIPQPPAASESSLPILQLPWEPPILVPSMSIWSKTAILEIHKRFLQYVQQKITKVCDLVCKYIHMLAVVSLVLDAISSVALDQLSGQSKQSFVVLATSLLLPVFGFACIKGRTASNIRGRTKRQLIGVVEVVFAMVQLIITTLVHFTLTISGATNNYNAPWFPLAFAAIVVFVFKAIPTPDSRIVLRYIEMAELNSYEDLYKKVEQMYNIQGQLVGSESEWELTYISTWYEWQVVKSDEPWWLFRCLSKVIIIRRRSISSYQQGRSIHDDDDDDGGVNDRDEDDDANDGDDDDNDGGDGGGGSGGVSNDDDDGVKDDGKKKKCL